MFRPSSRRGTALYVSTVATALIASSLGLTALSVVRIERRQALTVNDRLVARAHARSAVELGLKQIANDASWRTTFVNNVETTPLSLGSGSPGTVSWKISDADGSLSDADAKLTLRGIGRVGSVLQIAGVEVQAGPVGPVTWGSYTNLIGANNDSVRNDKWYAQRFTPTLPSDANGWRVSSVQLMSQRAALGVTVTFRLYRNSLSAANLVETVNLNSSGFPATASWYTVNFSSTPWMQPSDTAYITVETTSVTVPISIRYRNSGVAQAGSAFIRGTPAWEAEESDKSLLYRADGYYTTPSGIAAVAGSWTWEEL